MSLFQDSNAAETVFPPTPASGPSPNWPPSWDEIQKKLAAKDKEGALSTLLTHRLDSPIYDYNIGTLYLELNQPGKAFAYLEKASQSVPREPSIQRNLLIARKQLEANAQIGKIDPGSTWLESLLDPVPQNEILGVMGMLLFLLCGFWLRAYRKARRLRVLLTNKAGLITLAALTLSSLVLLAEKLSLRTRPAWSLEVSAIRSGPGESYSELSRTITGMKLRLTGATQQSEGGSEQWFQVRFAPDSVGWIPDSALLR